MEETMSIEIPVVSLSQLRQGNIKHQEALLQGLSDFGLIHIADHNLDQEEIDAFYDSFHRFCDQSIEEKNQYSTPEIWYQRGWTPPDTEKAVIAGGQPDFKECYFAAPLPITNELQLEYPQICAPNVWPSHLPNFKDRYLKIGQAIHEVGCILLEGCAQALGLDKECFTQRIQGGAHVMRALNYIPLHPSQVNTGIRWGEEHTDFNLLTLLPGGRFFNQDGSHYTPKQQAGLYLRTRANDQYPQGLRIKGSAPKGCMIAQVGQQLEILTGGRLLATPHEILPPQDPYVGRMSIAHFMHMHPHQLLSPLPSFKTENAIQAYRPAVLAGNYSLKTLVDIGLAPQEALNALGYRFYARLEQQRTHT
jgi:isopenicillin N synthase-like dioxygenase